ncbi:MAG TPA: PDZ domain-containing protein, partial [Anaerolineales bacterium]
MLYLSQRTQTVLNRVLQIVVLVYQAVAVLVFISTLYLATDWLRNPFIGGFFEHTLVLNGSNTSEEGKSWEMYEQGFDVGDQLVSVHGAPVSTSDELREILASKKVGEQVTVEVRTTETTVERKIFLQELSSADRTAFFYIPESLSFVFLIVSLWIFGLRRTEPAGRAYSLFTSSLAIVVSALFELYTSHRLTYIWTLALGLTGGALIDLALGFPQEVRVVIGRPYLRWTGYLVSIALVLNAYSTLFNFEDPTAYITAWQVIYGFDGLAALFYFGMLFYHAVTSRSPVVKNQTRTILIGSLIAFGPVVAWFLFAGEAFNPYLLPFLIVFPLVNGYVVLRFRLLRTDYWVRQGMVYALLTVFVVAAYGLFVSGIALVIPMPSDNPYLIGGLVFVIAVLLNPLRNRLQVLVDGTFFRGQRAYEDRIRTFSHEMTRALDIEAIGRVIRRQVMATLTPDRLHIYTYDALNDQYAALLGEDGRPTSDIRFSSTSPLVQYFQQENIPLYLDTVNPQLISLKGDEARLSLL